MGVVNSTPRPLYPRESPGNHFIGGWVGLTAGLDGCRKPRPPPRFDPRTTSHSSIYFYLLFMYTPRRRALRYVIYMKKKYLSLIIQGTSTKKCCNVCASFHSTKTSLRIRRTIGTGKMKPRSSSHVRLHKTIRLRENYEKGIPCLW